MWQSGVWVWQSGVWVWHSEVCVGVAQSGNFCFHNYTTLITDWVWHSHVCGCGDYLTWTNPHVYLDKHDYPIWNGGLAEPLQVLNDICSLDNVLASLHGHHTHPSQQRTPQQLLHRK